MSTELETGVTYDPPQKIAKAAATDYEMVDSDDQVHATAEIVVTLPLNPRLGQDHILVATGGDITIDPNGNSISGSTNVAQGTAVRVVFDIAFEWVVYAGSGGGGGTPAAPNRAIQFNDAGTFGAATWHFEADDSLHATADGSSITQDDSGTGNTLTVYEHFVIAPGDPDPPGPAFIIGSSSAFDENTSPETMYVTANTFLELYTNPDGDATLDLYGIGAVFNGAAALTQPGILIRPNLVLQGFDQDPTDDLLGGGQGVFFFARNSIVPTTAPTSIAGMVMYVSQDDNKPYALNSDNERFAMFAQPAVITWGNQDVAATTVTRFLHPGYVDATAPVAASAVSIRVPFDCTVFNFFEHQTTAGGAGPIVFTVQKNGVDTTLTVTVDAATTGGGSDTTHSFDALEGDLLTIAVTKAGAVGTSPSFITGTVALRPTNPVT